MIDALIQQFESPLCGFSTGAALDVVHPAGVVRDELMQTHVYSQSKHATPVQSVPPLRIGVVFSGGPAPGGHDVLCGILNHLRPEDALIGFCNGPGGLLRSEHKVLTPDDIQLIEGVGGFDFLGTDRTKLSTTDQFNVVSDVIESMNMSVLIVVGGDDSNTNALFLSDALFGRCHVIGVPKTIDGDLGVPPYLPVTFGFHTATQHYARLVQQLAIDAVATKKYWHVVKLMGRSASHVALEVAHQVCPNACVLAEEIMVSGWQFLDVISYFSSVIHDRFLQKKPYGVIVFPEGMVGVIPEFQSFLSGDIGPLNECLLSIGASPLSMASVILDAHGNPNLSMLQSEKIIQDAIAAHLAHHYSDVSNVQLMAHFFGYTGRSEDPTAFDSAYALLLGKTAYELALSGVSSVIVGCDFSNQEVQPVGLPLIAMLHFDDARSMHVIQKQLVSTSDPDYQAYVQQKSDWVTLDAQVPRSAWFEYPYRFRLGDEW